MEHWGCPKFDAELERMVGVFSHNRSGFTPAEAVFWIARLSAAYTSDMEGLS